MKPEKLESRDTPRVSVFHMVYNQIEGLREGVEASLSQDYPNLEIVFSDDHSADGSYEMLVEVVAEYTGPHDVRVFRNSENLGLVGNFNTCVERTHGQFIVQANGDDVAREDRVSKLVAKWQSGTDVLLVHSTSRYLGMDGVPGGMCNLRSEADYQNSPASYVVDRYHALGASAAYDRRIFEYFGNLPDIAVVEDCIMPFRARLLGRVQKVEEILVWLRPGGVSDGSNNGRKDEFMKYVSIVRTSNAQVYLDDLSQVHSPGKWRAILACRLVLLEASVKKLGMKRILAPFRPAVRKVLFPLLRLGGLSQRR